MANWYTGIYKSLFIASIICFVIYNFSSGSTSLGALLSGLVALSFTLIMILYIILYNGINLVKNASYFQSLITIMNISGPFIVMLGVIILILYLIIENKDRILKGRVSSSYYTFSNIAIIILLLQVYFVYNNISSSKFDNSKQISKVTSIILYLLSTIIGISSITLFFILKYYSADG
jgi:uncharacterized membrane protein